VKSAQRRWRQYGNGVWRKRRGQHHGGNGQQRSVSSMALKIRRNGNGVKSGVKSA
jgi:ribosomal protein L35